MPTLEEIAVVKKMKKPEKNFGQVSVAENQIPVGKKLAEGVAAFVKEVESQPIPQKSPDVHSRRILPSDKPTIHFDAQHPLPAREVMIHQDNLEAYREAAFEKHKLDLKKAREEIDALKKTAEPEESQGPEEEVAGSLRQEVKDELSKKIENARNNPAEQAEKIRLEKIAAIDKESAELERKNKETDTLSNAEILNERNKIGGQPEAIGKNLPPNIREPGFGRSPIVVKKGLPPDDYDRRQSPREMKNPNQPVIRPRREYDPEIGAVLKDLDRLTDSENILDHHEAAKIIKGLTLEQAQKVKEKASPRLMEKLDSIEAPEFGRKESRRKEPINDPWRKDSEVYDRIVVPSDRKKAPRGYEKAEPIDLSNVPIKKKATEYIYDKDFAAKKARAAEEAAKIKHSKQAPAENFLTLEQAEEIDAIADELRRKKLAEVVSVPEAVFEKKEGDDEKHENFWKKSGRFLEEHKELAVQLLKTGISIPASILGYKSFYDVPAYFVQRYAVRGNIMGMGKGKGLAGSVEELLEASQLHKAIKDNGNENTPGFLMKAIKDLDSRLTKTKEGSEKNSEQRNKIAKLLWENRHQEKQTVESREKELENILDNYTTTKVTGIQAAREALNTACVATGAFALRGVAYGGLAFFESYEKMRREEKVKALEKGPEVKAEEVNTAKVFANGLQVTYEGLVGLKDLRDLKGLSKKEKLQKGLKIGLAAVKSFGSIARFTGIVIGMGTGGHVYGASLDKVIDFFEHKDKLAAIGGNFANNTDRLLKIVPSIGAVFADSLGHSETNLAGSSAFHETPATELPYKPSAKFDFAAASAQVSSMTGEEIPEASFQGGKSVWQEGDKQLLARFGEKFAHLDKAAQEANIARLQNAITADPEAFGLPKDIDFNRMQLADLEKIKWNEAFNNVFDNREGLTEVVHNLDKTLAHPDENLVRFNGSVESAVPDLGDGQDVNAINYFSGEKTQAQLADWSDKAKRFYDPSTSQIEKRRIFAELQEARANIQHATGGTVTFGEDGDINVTLANGEVVNAFGNSHLPEVDIAQAEIPAEHPAAGPHRPSLGYNPLDQRHTGDLTPETDDDLALPETHRPSLGYRIYASGAEDSRPEGNFVYKPVSPHTAPVESHLSHLDNPQEMRGSINDVSVAQALAENNKNLDLRHVKNISNEALKVWQNRPGTYNFMGLQPQNINQETYEILSRFKGKILLNDEALRHFEKIGHISPEKLLDIKDQVASMYDKLRYAEWTRLVDSSAASKILDNAGVQEDIAKTVFTIQQGLGEMNTENNPMELAKLQQGVRELIEMSEKKYEQTLGIKKIYSEFIRKLAGLS